MEWKGGEGPASGISLGWKASLLEEDDGIEIQCLGQHNIFPLLWQGGSMAAKDNVHSFSSVMASPPLVLAWRLQWTGSAAWLGAVTVTGVWLATAGCLTFAGVRRTSPTVRLSFNALSFLLYSIRSFIVLTLQNLNWGCSFLFFFITFFYIYIKPSQTIFT